MTDTTPDYAGLLERFEESPNHAIILAAYERRELITALRTLLDSNAALERERDQLRDKLHCMCGSPIDHSAWEGHTPVSVYDYSLDQERSRAERAEAELAEVRQELGEMRLVLEQTERNAERIIKMRDAQLAEANRKIAEKDKALEAIKARVTGDRYPNWYSSSDVTSNRMWIADTCDAARRALEEQGGE